MKLVREGLDFERGKTPLKSMGIGLLSRRVFKDITDAAQWAYQFPDVCTQREVKTVGDWKNFFEWKTDQSRYRLTDSNLRFKIAKWFQSFASFEDDGRSMNLSDAKSVLEKLESIIQENIIK